MNKLRFFWAVFKKSLLEPEYYNDVLKAPFKFSIKYLFGLLFMVLFIKGLIFGLISIPFLPKVSQLVGQSKVFFKDLYPSGLTLTLKDGNVRTNVDEPYFVPFPEITKIKDQSLLVIDTKAKAGDIKKHKTVFFLTKNSFVYLDTQSKEGYRVNPLTDYKGYGVFNREAYDRLFTRISPYFSYIPALLYVGLVMYVFLGPFLAVPFSFALVFLYLIIMCFFLFLITYLMKKTLQYKSILQLGLHGITFPIILDLFASSFRVDMPFVYPFSFFMWMIIVIHALKSDAQSKLSPH